MSLELDWRAITDAAALASLRDTLNARLAGLAANGVVEGLCISELLLGATPPEIRIEDIQDPRPEFCAGSARSADGSEDAERMQLSVRIHYSDAVRVVLQGALVVNYPAPSFLALPVCISISRIRVSGSDPPCARHSPQAFFWLPIWAAGR